MTGKLDVWAAVEAFRERHLACELARLPVDVFTLAELELRLDVIPFDDLFAKYESDAAITPDFSGIYVDAEAYILWEKGPVWKQNRLRFSVAHELGHYVLHREIAATLNFNSFEGFVRWTQSHEGQKYALEQAANEFAGRLLVPVERLRQLYDEFSTEFDAKFPHWRAHQVIRYFLAESVAPKFGVNSQVIEVRLDREGIWPVN
jgi:Zn-dependent peptidase ImmA (M78 family)